MAKKQMISKNTDSKGRITLGEAFANKTMLVDWQDDQIILRFARVIPESEAWVYENPKALESLRRGLGQARDKKFSRKGPDLEEAKILADKLQDD